MNLAIEYILRSRRARQLLHVPCSFFVVSQVTYHKKVISIHKCYGDDTSVNVKHWNLHDDSEDRMLPPFVDFSLKTEDLFTNDIIILPDHHIVEYTETPYVVGNKQYADAPRSTSQIRDYESSLQNIFNNETHQRTREDWLWSSFASKHVSENLNWQHDQETNRGKQLQRNIIEVYDKSLWKKWLSWKKHLDINQSWIAPELIMRWEYNENKLKPEELMPLTSSHYFLSGWNSFSTTWSTC